MPGPGGAQLSPIPDSSIESLLKSVPDFMDSVSARLKMFADFLFTESVDSALSDYVIESDNLIVKAFGLVYSAVLDLAEGTFFYDFFNTPIISMIFGFGFPALMLFVIVRFFLDMFN